MLEFMLLMIQTEPPISSTTNRTPKASAMTLLMLSGPVVMWRKNTRCTPIWAMAKTITATGTAGAHTNLACTTAKEQTVSRVASARPMR